MSEPRHPYRVLLQVTALVSAAFIGWHATGYVLRQNDQDAREADHSLARGQGNASAATETVDEFVLVFIGSSSCAPSNAAWAVSAVTQAKELVSVVATARGIGVAHVGISVDAQANAGLRHLGKFGRWDEIVVGGWRNVGLLRYVWQDVPGVAATPQVLVVKRTYDTTVLNGSLIRTGVLAEELVVRRVGQEIVEWVNGGAPMIDNDHTDRG